MNNDDIIINASQLEESEAKRVEMIKGLGLVSWQSGSIHYSVACDNEGRMLTAGSAQCKNWLVRSASFAEIDELFFSSCPRFTETLEEHFKDKKKYAPSKDVGGIIWATLIGTTKRQDDIKTRTAISLDIESKGDADDIGDNKALYEAWLHDEREQCLPADQLQFIRDQLDMIGCAYSIHSTRKSRGFDPRGRVIIPLSREVAPDQYGLVVASVVDLCALHNCAARESYTANQMMYLPSCCADGKYVHYAQPNRGYIDPDVLLRYAHDNGLTVPKQHAPQRDAKKFNCDKGDRVACDPLNKDGVIGAFNRYCQDIPTAISRYALPYSQTHNRNRWIYDGSTSGMPGVELDPDDSDRPDQYLWSAHASDPANGYKLDAFHLVMIHRFGGDSDDAFTAMLEMVREQLGDDEDDEIVPGATVHTIQSTMTDTGDRSEPATRRRKKYASLDDPWPEVKNEKATPPEYEFSVLFGHWKDFAEKYSLDNNIPLEWVFCAMVQAVSAAVCGSIEVPYRKAAAATQSVQLWSVFAGSSGSRKSAVLGLLKPLDEYLHAVNKTRKADNKLRQDQADDERHKISDMRKALAKKKITDSEKKTLQSEIQQSAEYINTINAEMRPKLPSFISDFTPEGVAKVVQGSHGRANIVSDEAAGVNVLIGKTYGGNGSLPNLDIFLKGYDGGSLSIVRRNSDDIDLDSINLSILLGIQKTPLRELAEDPTAVDRGLSARFLFFAPERTNRPDYDPMADGSLTTQQWAEWSEYLKKLAEYYLLPTISGKTVMRMTPEAEQWVRHHEAKWLRLCEQVATQSDALATYYSKAHGKAIRLAAILALLEDPAAREINFLHASAAGAIMDSYFIPMAKYIFSPADGLNDHQRDLVEWFAHHEQDTVTGSELAILRKRRTAFKGEQGKKAYQTAMATLAEFGYVRQIETQPTNGRPQILWQINRAAIPFKS